MASSGYIIEKYGNMASAYTCHRLVKEAQCVGLNLEIIGAQDSYLQDGRLYHKGEPLEARDFVINRYKWGKVKDAINASTSRSYNNIEAFNVFVNKYEQITRLESNCFKKPEFILGNNQTPFEELKRHLGIPFVAKSLENSMGQEIFLIENESDYKHTVADSRQELLYETFIKSSYGRDLRLFSIRGQAFACMMRQSTNDFRSNVALGAKVTNVPISKTLMQISDDLWQQTHLDFIGIDLLFGEDCYYLCEINVMPGIEGIESASGLNIANKIMSIIALDLT